MACHTSCHTHTIRKRTNISKFMGWGESTRTLSVLVLWNATTMPNRSDTFLCTWMVIIDGNWQFMFYIYINVFCSCIYQFYKNFSYLCVHNKSIQMYSKNWSIFVLLSLWFGHSFRSSTNWIVYLMCPCIDSWCSTFYRITLQAKQNTVEHEISPTKREHIFV